MASVSTASISLQPEWRSNGRARENRRAGILAASNGTTNFGEVVGGTVLANDGDGKLRPCAMQQATAIGSGVNAMTVHDARNFYVGDVVHVINGTATEDGAVIVAGDNPSNLTVTSKPSAAEDLKINIIVAGTSTAYSHSYDTVTHTITINSATSGADAATTTVGTVANTLNSTYGALCSAVAEIPADLVVDVGPTTLAGRLAAGAMIAEARDVTAVVKTGTNTITFDGATVTFGTDDYIVVAAGEGTLEWMPVGVLDSTVSTVRYVGTTEVAGDQVVEVANQGDARTTGLIGHCAAMTKALRGGPFVAIDGNTYTPAFEGFSIRDL